MEFISVSSSRAALNEDTYIIGSDYLVVIDGATNLGVKTKYNANWFVLELKKYLKEELDKKYDIKETLTNSINKIKQQVDSDFNEVSCSIIIVRKVNDKLQYCSLGDCTGVIEFKNKVEVFYKTKLEEFDNKSIEVINHTAKQKNISFKEAMDTKEALDILVKHRNLKNKTNGYYTLDLSRIGIQYIDIYEFELKDVNNVLLMTDGFDDVITIYHLYNYEEIISVINQRGLEKIVSELYEAQDSDATLDKYNRFKHSDDATCVLAKIL